MSVPLEHTGSLLLLSGEFWGILGIESGEDTEWRRESRESLVGIREQKQRETHGCLGTVRIPWEDKEILSFLPDSSRHPSSIRIRNFSLDEGKKRAKRVQPHVKTPVCHQAGIIHELGIELVARETRPDQENGNSAHSRPLTVGSNPFSVRCVHVTCTSVCVGDLLE